MILKVMRTLTKSILYDLHENVSSIQVFYPVTISAEDFEAKFPCDPEINYDGFIFIMDGRDETIALREKGYKFEDKEYTYKQVSFKDKDGVRKTLITDEIVYILNDSGQTIEKI